MDTADDAGVFLLNETTALVQTVDFFTPIVDDPYTFGQIAAVNSLSDVYAMGGHPLTAMNIVGFPSCSLPPEVLRDILQGGQDKVTEAGAVLVGGHTVEDDEPKYGLSVTGIVDPNGIWTNAGAQLGDVLILTKSLGTGILTTAAKGELFTEYLSYAIAAMVELNDKAARAGHTVCVHACTDVTGFGLLGHTYEMAAASHVRLTIHSKALPILPGALEAAAQGLVPAGAYANRHYLTTVTFADSVPENMRDLCFDPQTSGGLLFSIPAAEQDKLLAALESNGIVGSRVIGEVKTIGKGDIDVD